MAIWLPNNKDDSDAPTCYVPGLPYVSQADGVQDNPNGFFQKESIGNAGNAVQKYMHYCTRMLRWNDINLDPFTVSGTPTINKTKRFGDLGSYHVSDAYGIRTSGGSVDLDSAFTRYRFPSEEVPYHLYDYRGVSVGTGFPFTGKTCGWLPAAEDSGFFWVPTTTDLSNIETGLEAFLVSKSTSLSALAALPQVWNLCIIAWMWAGYDGGATEFHDGEDRPSQGLSGRLTELRAVKDCDVYYLPYLY